MHWGWGGVSNFQLPGKSVTKVYSSILLAFWWDWRVSIFQKKHACGRVTRVIYTCSADLLLTMRAVEMKSMRVNEPRLSGPGQVTHHRHRRGGCVVQRPFSASIFCKTNISGNDGRIKLTLKGNLKRVAKFRPASTGIYHALACDFTQILAEGSGLSHRPMRDKGQ